MKTFARFYASLALAWLTVAGCDQPKTPTGPSVAAAPAVASQGQITVLSVEPENGATITAEPCDGGYCNSEVRFAFDVQFNQDVTEPWVAVSFYDDLQRQCATSGFPNIVQAIAPLRANTATTFRVSFLAFSTVNGTPCRATKMAAQLSAQRGRSAALLTREFAHSYTFVLP